MADYIKLTNSYCELFRVLPNFSFLLRILEKCGNGHVTDQMRKDSAERMQRFYVIRLEGKMSIRVQWGYRAVIWQKKNLANIDLQGIKKAAPTGFEPVFQP